MVVAASEAASSLYRVIRIRARGSEVRAVVADDFHHFRVALSHDGVVITSISTGAVRAPWSLCEAAGGELSALVGRPLTSAAAEVFRYADARLQCTHQFDLAALAIAAAARGTRERRYDALVPDVPATPGDRRGRADWALVERDGEPILSWRVRDFVVREPEPFAGLGLGAGFTGWVSANLPGEEAEAALVLRRAVFISAGRGHAGILDGTAHSPASGGCWVQQAERAEKARRIVGSTIDFGCVADRETRRDDPWLAFAAD